MKKSRDPEPWSPRFEELAAYAAGGLEAALRERIKTWLAGHPNERAEVEAQRRLLQLCQSTAPAEPSEAAWSLLWDRVKETAAAPAPPGAPRRWGRKVAWSIGLLVGTAAAVLLLVRPSFPPPPQRQPVLPPAAEEPFPVVRADEVDILRVDGDDTDSVVVGELPLTGPVVLAAPGEVSLVQVEEQENPPRAAVQMVRQDNPMIWAPLEAASNK